MAKGLYTNSELLDSLVVDLNSLIKEQMTGQYINACNIVNQMAQKLISLRKTIDDDIKNRDKTIETLKEELRLAGHEVNDMTPQQFMDDFMNKGNDSAE